MLLWTCSHELGRASAPRRAPLLALMVMLLALSQGCRVGPEYTPPAAPLPDQWHVDATQGLDDGTTHLHSWWQTLEDPILDSIVDRAIAGNLDLRLAVQRIAEARALYGVASGARYPSVDGVGFWERNGSKGTILDAGPPAAQRSDWGARNFYGTGFDATWEIDVFGRVSRSVESSQASFEATVEDYRDVLVTLLADVAFNYVELRALQKRLEVTDQNVGTQKGTLRLTTDRYEAELVGQLDVRQAEQNLASTESTIPQLRIAMIGALNRLAVLLGVVPGALADELGGDAPIPQGEDPVNAGVPADMLRQRPDVRAAERQLAAQTALIGVATADLYPRFTLSGVFAFEGASAQIFQPNGITWGFGPQFRWNIFDGGRIRSTIKVEDARTDQALSTYEQTVLLALEDVENSMVSYQQEKIRRDALHRSVVAARKAVDLVDTLYRTGLVDFQNVLDTQRTQFVEEDRLVQSEGFVTQNLIGIYRALGGGWEPPPSSTTETLAAEDEEAVTASNGS
jgi:multidrug efflux system outer membrane protein